MIAPDPGSTTQLTRSPTQHRNDNESSRRWAPSPGAHDAQSPGRVPQPPLAAPAAPAAGGAKRQSTTTTTTAAAKSPPGNGHGLGLPFVKPSSYLRRKPNTGARRTMAEKPAPMSALDREQMQGLVSRLMFLSPFLRRHLRHLSALAAMLFRCRRASGSPSPVSLSRQG